MIEFLNTLDPVDLSFYIAFLILALLILGVSSHFRINEIYDVGYNAGKADLDREILRESSVFNFAIRALMGKNCHV